MLVLGISAFYHDSAAALVRDGEILAAAQEERFTREKHDQSFPHRAAEYCLDAAGVGLDAVDAVGFYDKPILTFGRLLETHLAYAPRGLSSFTRSIPIWVKEKILQKNLIVKGLEELGRGSLDREKVMFGFHHHSHAASAFYPSPFRQAAVLVMDGVGEWATTSLGSGRDETLELTREIRFPHSLGLLYSAFTYYLGFKVNDGEYKIMGLAPYGEPRYADSIYEHLLDLKDDGSFHLDLDYFDYCTGLTMTNARFDAVFGGPPRKPGDPLTQKHMDIARSVQAVTEEVVLRIAHGLHRETGLPNLCLAGGVALNCVANGRLLRESPFERIWIQPAAGDAGGALGVALSISHAVGGTPRKRLDDDSGDAMHGSYLGPSFDSEACREVLEAHGAVGHELDDASLFEDVSQALADEKVVGWFQGRMEFGPRALGNRSILGDPRSPRMQRVLNLKIKYRESFRPFAPAVLREEVSEYFEIDTDSPYMLQVAPVGSRWLRALTPADKELEGLAKLDAVRSDLPAITHVDCSARIQTVHPETNPRFHRLISSFKQKTGIGVLVNTSFNVRDEPVVCSPEDAYRCFMATEMDILVLGNIVLYKEKQ